MVFGFTKKAKKAAPKRTNSETSIVEETLRASSKLNAEKSAVKNPNQTATGQTPSRKINRKLQTRAQIEKIKPKLPPDYRKISEGVWPEMSRITSNLFMTSCFGLIKENFDKYKITNIINISYECPDILIEGVSYLRVLVDDDPSEDLTPHFDKVAKNIEEEAKKNGRTVVHCVAGVSRSAAFVIAYLIKYKKQSLREAFVLLRKARNVVKPNQAFFEQLIRFEKRIRGSNSTKMIQITRNGTTITVPDLWNDYPKLIDEDIWIAKHCAKNRSAAGLPATAAGVIAAQKQN